MLARPTMALLHIPLIKNLPFLTLVLSDDNFLRPWRRFRGRRVIKFEIPQYLYIAS